AAGSRSSGSDTARQGATPAAGQDPGSAVGKYPGSTAGKEASSAAGEGREHVHAGAATERTIVIGAGHAVDQEARAADHPGRLRGGACDEDLDELAHGAGAHGRL